MMLNKGTHLYNSVDEVLEQAKKVVNHRVSDFNVNHRSLTPNNKGVIGQIVEEGVFHYPINSNHEADFANLGIELKVTGLKFNKNRQLVMKERLVLNIINYEEEALVDFNHSSFWGKNEVILLIFYLYDYDLKDFDFMFLESFLLRYNEKDLVIIKNDWLIIHNKILQGNAHNISEADTMYLAACPKGINSSSLRFQPYSQIKAKQRAYCLKTSYMNTIVASIFNKEQLESIFSLNQLQRDGFEIAVRTTLAPYYGKCEDELFEQFKVDRNSKAKYNMLVGAMLGLKGSINRSEEFTKGNIELKTIRVEEDGHIEQHMSFPYFKYEEIVNQEFEESDIFEKLYSTKFMFVVFKKKEGKYYFEKILFWNMPLSDIDEYVQPIFNKTVDVIKNGNIVKEETENKLLTNFPGSKENGVCHVRPHDAKGIKKLNNGLPLPVPDRLTGLTQYTRYCFWLDRNYIRKIIVNN